MAYARHGEPEAFLHKLEEGADELGGTEVLLEPACGSMWSYASDAHITPSSLQAALAAEAYILFYERVKVRKLE